VFYEIREFFRNITKGEVIITCIALVVWTTICVFINMAISNAVMKSNEVYYKAIQIDNDEKLFEYAMRTNAGNALVYGTAKSLETVSDEKLKKQYLAIKVYIDRYEEKVRYEDITDDEGNVIGQRAIYYEEWCSYQTYSSHSNVISFLGTEFPYSTLSISNYTRLSLNSDTVKDEYVSDISMNYIYPNGIWSSVGDLRYSYYIVPLEQPITVLADLRNNTMYNVQTENRSVDIHYNSTIDEVMKSITNSESLPNIVFSIVWYILFIVGACFFVCERNRWADC